MFQDKKLTILILSHKRPKLYKRCIQSIFLNKPCTVDVIVNNDSNDIYQIFNETIYYNRFNNLTSIYKFLFDIAKTEYIYFLEDDDILLPSFYDAIKYCNEDYDAITGSYIKAKFGHNAQKFLNRCQKFDINSCDFQLSQVVFKKKLLNFNLLFNNCNGNCVLNDYYLFINSKIKNIKKTNKFFFKQTIDGYDNISVPQFTNLNKCLKCKKNIIKRF